jgi:hypothetical protein
MTKTAYTIGRTTVYERGIYTPGGVKKAEGGWVWKTIQQAQYFIDNQMQQMEPSWKPEDFSVYELCLPNNW